MSKDAEQDRTWRQYQSVRSANGARNFTDNDGQGATLYDRRARSGSVPAGAKGVFARRDGGREHTTQYYSDKYRLSSDIVDNENVKRHWIDQNVSKKHRNRHVPPNDAR